VLSDTNALLRALRMNGVFSGSSAILMFVAANWLKVQFSLQSPAAIYAVGGFLALFAVQLGNIVRSRRIRRWEIKCIIGGDIAWVVASLVLVALYESSMTAVAVMLVDFVTVAVLFLAIQQIRGLRSCDKATMPDQSGGI
jgi:hypothetical protein